MQLQEAWDNKLVFPLAELGKRYLRRDFGVLLDCSVNHRTLGIAEYFSLAILSNCDNNLNSCACRNDDTRTRVNDCEFPVLIKSVHIMDDTKGIAFSIAPSVVWLHVSNKVENLGIRNSLYFSLISANFLFRKRLFREDRELDGVFPFEPVFGAGKVPSDVIETGSQVMDDFATQHAKTWRYGETTMVVKRLLPLLRVHIGEDWILASFEESPDSTVKINDVLVGPF